MKSLFSKSSLAALVAGALIAVSAQSFTVKNDTTEYAFDQDQQMWIPVSQLTPGVGPGEYTCENSSAICKGLFNNNDLPDEAEDQPLEEGRVSGRLTIH
jgi:hypothetical protein